MNYTNEALPKFSKDIKQLKKKFPKIKNDLLNLINDLNQNPNIGIDLGNDFYKIRIVNSSIPTGKSGGFRVVTYYKKYDTLYLITIYSKTKQDKCFRLINL